MGFALAVGQAERSAEAAVLPPVVAEVGQESGSVARILAR
jgi:hypothetical protein